MQNGFLQRARGCRVSVLLTNGETFAGALEDFDTFTLSIDGQLVFKAAIAAVMLNGSTRGADGG